MASGTETQTKGSLFLGGRTATAAPPKDAMTREGFTHRDASAL